MATLYHWDLPQALQDDGGWLNRDTIDRFADYADIVGRALGDRVDHWIPINEPNVVTLHGLRDSACTPPAGRCSSTPCRSPTTCCVAHGRAAIALRRAGATSVGCANNHAPIWPASDSDADVGAAKLFDALWNGMYLEGDAARSLPRRPAAAARGRRRARRLATIRQPLDFYGVNYYNPMKVAALAEDDAELPFEILELLGYPTTDSGWPIVPDALREWLIMFRARYRAALPPIVITESGCSYDDGPDEHGVVDDQRRIDYLDAHLRAVATAIQRGVDIRGYYTWSLMDNFEWAEGFRQRFGLVHVDYETQVRTPKKSFHWYARPDRRRSPEHAG